MAHDTKVVVFASQKGGSGKTTLSGHIAVEAERAGAGPVALIDTDPQGSLAKWWNARSSDAPVFARTTVPNLKRDIDILRENGIKLIVIDTPPAVTNAISEVVSHADLVVVPTRPSPHDLRAVGITVDLVECQKKPLVFVVNCATARARITMETAVTLSQHGTVAPVTVHNRVDFAASMIDGRTVGEVSETCRSAKEVSTLWKYLEERLRKQRRDEMTIDDIGRHFEVELLTPVAGSDPDHATPPEPVERANGWIGATPHEAVVDKLDGFVRRPPVDRLGELKALKGAAQNSNWDGIDRRRIDSGPPPGAEERRRTVPTFGRRNVK